MEIEQSAVGRVNVNEEYEDDDGEANLTNLTISLREPYTVGLAPPALCAALRERGSIRKGYKY